MIIDATYDASGNSAPSGFKSAVASAIAYFENTFSAAITVTITFSWSGLNGSLGQSVSQVETHSYASVMAALATHDGGTNGLQSETFPANDPFPSTDPAQPSPTLDVTTAETRALGLDATAPASDGTVTLGSGLAWTFGTTPVPGDFSAISALKHEIAEVLGRQAGGDGSFDPTPLALYRYSSPGVIDASNGATGGYFSVDGGVHEVNPNGTFATGSGGGNGYALGESARGHRRLGPADRQRFLRLWFPGRKRSRFQRRCPGHAGARLSVGAELVGSVGARSGRERRRRRAYRDV